MLAISLADAQEVSLEEAFEYVYHYTWHYLGNPQYQPNKSKNRETISNLTDTDVRYLYFDRGFGFNDICRILTCQAKKLLSKSLDQYSDYYLLGRFYNQNDEDKYRAAYDWFVSHRKPKHTAFDYCLYQFLISKGFEFEAACKKIQPGGQKQVNDLLVLEAYDNIRRDEEILKAIEEMQKAEEKRNIEQYEIHRVLNQFYGDQVSQMACYDEMSRNEEDDMINGSDFDERTFDLPPDEQSDEEVYDDFGGAEIQYEADETPQIDDDDEHYYYLFGGRMFDFNIPEEYQAFCEAVEQKDPDNDTSENNTIAERRMTLYTSLRDACLTDANWLCSEEYLQFDNKAAFSTFGNELPVDSGPFPPVDEAFLADLPDDLF